MHHSSFTLETGNEFVENTSDLETPSVVEFPCIFTDAFVLNIEGGG